MTKKVVRVSKEEPVFQFRNPKEKKYFTLIILDLILLCMILTIVPNVFRAILLSTAIIALIFLHFKSYNKAVKER